MKNKSYYLIFRHQKIVLVGICLFLFALPLIAVTPSEQQNISNRALAATLSFPTSPPAQICGNSSILGGGPATPPAGAIIVPAGDNSGFNLNLPAGATFWFAPGVHTLGNTAGNQIIPPDNSTYIGAPGAVLDGQNINSFAFTQHGRNVRIAYLEIRNFAAPRNNGVVNHDSGKGWTIENNWIHHNKGGGAHVGTNGVLRYNCLADNGQYGFQAIGAYDEVGGSNVTIDHNEVARNNTDDWENYVFPDGSVGCGCTGGAKFWLVNGATVTNNWVHDNASVGLWFDVNNQGVVVENNLIENQFAEGLFLEQGYDARVRYNNFKRNTIGKGRKFQSRGDTFPIGSLYVSESGSPAGYGLKTVPMVISDNNFEDNWGGVTLWENPNRYSGANGNWAGTIKIGAALNDASQCKSGTPNVIPDSVGDKYRCRWSTENVIVENNDFRINKAAVGAGCEGGNFCGINGIFSITGSLPEFSGYAIPWRITFQQGNIFRNNRYVGDWRFAGFEPVRFDGARVTWQDWTAPAPPVPSVFTNDNRPTTFGQDAGSTYSLMPPAALVTVGGRVTKQNGSVIKNAQVTMTDSQGAVKTAITDSSGYYRFANVRAEQSYTFSASYRNVQFAQSPRTLLVTGENLGINFIATH